jgi:hypothetical protein
MILSIVIDDTTYTVDTDTDLVIDSDNLTGEMKKIAGQFAIYSALSAKLYAQKKDADQDYEAAVATAKEQYDVAKDQLQELESSTFLQVKARLDKEKTKYTNPVLSGLVDDDMVVQSKRREVAKARNIDNNKQVKEARQKAIKAEERYRTVKTLADAFMMKANILQSLGAMARSEMSMAGGVNTRGIADTIDDLIHNVDSKTN